MIHIWMGKDKSEYRLSWIIFVQELDRILKWIVYLDLGVIDINDRESTEREFRDNAVPFSDV